MNHSIYNRGEASGVIKLGPDGNILMEKAVPADEVIHDLSAFEEGGSHPTGVVLLDPDGTYHVNTPQSEEPEPEPKVPPPPPEPKIDVDALKQEAYLQGFEDGKQEAIRNVTQELDLYKHNLQSMMQCIPEEIRNGIAQSEGQLVELSLAIARRLIQKESEESRDIVKGVLKEAMEQVKNQTILAIHLNPRDVGEIQPQFPDGRVELIPDPSIEPGGCRIETDMGEMDATLDSQWMALESAIRAQKAGE